MVPVSGALLPIAVAMALLPRTSAVSWVLGHEGESCAEACAQGCSQGEAHHASTPEAFGAIAEQLNVRCDRVVEGVAQSGGNSYGPSISGRTCRLYAGGAPPQAQAFCDLKPPPSEARFCPCRGRPFPEEYDCDAGLLRWQQGWSTGKKKWCCANHGKGCPAREGAPQPRSYAQLRGPVPIFDCMVTQTNRRDAWSPDQQEWCCSRKFVGCRPGQVTVTSARSRLVEQLVYWLCSIALIVFLVICYSIWGGEDTARQVPYGQSARSLLRASRATSDLEEEAIRDKEAQEAKEAAAALAERLAEAEEAEARRRDEEEAERRRRKEQEAAAEEGATRAGYSAGTLLRGARKSEDVAEAEKAKRRSPCGPCACGTSTALVSEPQPRRQ